MTQKVDELKKMIQEKVPKLDLSIYKLLDH